MEILFKKIEFFRLHERAFGFAYDNYGSDFSELLMTNNESDTHEHNIKIFMKEIDKFENELSPPLTDGMFQVW